MTGKQLKVGQRGTMYTERETPFPSPYYLCSHQGSTPSLPNFSTHPLCLRKLWCIACPSWDVRLKKPRPILHHDNSTFVEISFSYRWRLQHKLHPQQSRLCSWQSEEFYFKSFKKIQKSFKSFPSESINRNSKNYSWKCQESWKVMLRTLKSRK